MCYSSCQLHCIIPGVSAHPAEGKKRAKWRNLWLYIILSSSSGPKKWLHEVFSNHAHGTADSDKSCCYPWFLCMTKQQCMLTQARSLMINHLQLYTSFITSRAQPPSSLCLVLLVYLMLLTSPHITMRFPARPPPLYSILVVSRGLGGYHTSTINYTVAHVTMRFPAPLPPLYSNVGGGQRVGRLMVCVPLP